MSFVGELEHLPIVDVIQLLNSTRKSGTLCVRSSKSQSQLVFENGYIVGANHANNSVRIGRILVEMNAITEEELEYALTEQKNAGSERLPLIASLLEGGKVAKEVAYRGLETLIELTIVEILTWNSGTFELDINKTAISDEFRYFPDKLDEEICLNTQSVLMDALRIFDEKIRDGKLSEGIFPRELPVAAEAEQSSAEITPDLLGLDDFDSVAHNIPDLFTGVRGDDSGEGIRKSAMESLTDISLGQQKKLLSFISEFKECQKVDDNQMLAIVLLSSDDLLIYLLTEIYKTQGSLVFTTDDVSNLDVMIEKSTARDLVPVLVIDNPEKETEKLSEVAVCEAIRHIAANYPATLIIQLITPDNFMFSYKALQMGIRMTFLKPAQEQNVSFADETICFLTALHQYLGTMRYGSETGASFKLRDYIHKLDGLTEAPDVSLVLLQFVVEQFDRAITFVIGNSELIAEQSFGIKTDKSAGASPPLRFRIPVEKGLLFERVIEQGEIYYGEAPAGSLGTSLYNQITAPDCKMIALLPVKSMGKHIALIYADFGSKQASAIQISLLDIIARHAGLIIDNALYKKKYDRSALTA